MDLKTIETMISEACVRQRDEVLALVRLLSAQQSEIPGACDRNEQAETTRRTLDQIKAKDFVSPNEAAELLGCSPQHLRNLVHRAIEGRTAYPIPFCDLDGRVTFPVRELLHWSRTPKPKIKRQKARLRSFDRS